MLCNNFTSISQTGMAVHMSTCGKRRRRFDLLNGASSSTASSGTAASSSSASAPPLPQARPLTGALCALPGAADTSSQHEDLSAFQMDFEMCADEEMEAEVEAEEKAKAEAQENAPLLSSNILQSDRQPGGVDGKADPYIPQWSRVSTKFLDLQEESRRRGGLAGVGIIEGPVTRLMRLPRSILHTAVAKSALRLSKKRMNKMANFAKTLCADQFRGAALQVPSVDTVKRHVSRACDRAIDDGVLRQATYHGMRPTGWRADHSSSLIAYFYYRCMPVLAPSPPLINFCILIHMHRQCHWTGLKSFRRTFLSPWTWCGMILGA